MVQELFADGDLQASLQQEFSGAAAVVDAVNAEVLLDHTDEEVVADCFRIGRCRPWTSLGSSRGLRARGRRGLTSSTTGSTAGQ